MKKIVLLLGGARSGKSRCAVEYARKNAERVLFVATATAGDEDMRVRIEKHKQDRPAAWRALEAAADVGPQITANAGDAQLVVIDCITMLINNVFSRFDENLFDTIDEAVLEEAVMAEITQLQNSWEQLKASFLIISNEVGFSIVPGNRMSRLYRDILGKANQTLAAKADEVFLMVAGIPLTVKQPAGGKRQED